MTPRIDTHQHIVPPSYRKWLIDQDIDAGGLPIPSWDSQTTISMMDTHGIDSAILSLSTPGVHLNGDDLGPAPTARSWARTVNEFAAETVKDHPDRFGFFATLTLPDVEGSLQEAQYALDVLDADGIILMSNVAGRYLGDPAFDALLDELNRRHAVIFIHPGELPAQPVPGLPSFAVDFLLDTTRAALNLSVSGTMDRCENLRIILSHGGGFLPYAAYRMAPLAGRGDPARGLETLKRFYFDLALCSTPTALPALLAFAEPSHITYGSDFPHAPAPAYEAMAAMLDAYQLTTDQRHAIDHGDAERLFPRPCRIHRHPGLNCLRVLPTSGSSIGL